jgi:hypothetical protein
MSDQRVSPESEETLNRDAGGRPDVFGEVLPIASRDEQAEGWGETPGDAADDGEESLRREVPPHHG